MHNDKLVIGSIIGIIILTSLEILPVLLFRISAILFLYYLFRNLYVNAGVTMNIDTRPYEVLFQRFGNMIDQHLTLVDRQVASIEREVRREDFKEKVSNFLDRLLQPRQRKSEATHQIIGDKIVPIAK